jgi:hypothetical protein
MHKRERSLCRRGSLATAVTGRRTGLRPGQAVQAVQTPASRPYPRMIDLPHWSTLTVKLGTPWPSAGHDQSFYTTALTSAGADRRAWVITRLPASGL